MLPDNQEFHSIPKMCDYTDHMCDQQHWEGMYTGQTSLHKLYSLPDNHILR